MTKMCSRLRFICRNVAILIYKYINILDNIPDRRPIYSIYSIYSKLHQFKLLTNYIFNNY